MRTIGYAICGAGEAQRYMENTLKEFARLCDETIIVLNNATDAERELVNKYGFHIKEDNRVWGENQHRIKQDLMDDVEKLNPDWCIALDLDEVFDPEFTRETIEKYSHLTALYVYVVNLWNGGWNKQWSFWNVRAWKWTGDKKFCNRPLHCGLAPESAYHYGSYIPYYLKHYGLMKSEDRQKKIERYQKFDPRAIYRDVSYYNALANGIDIPLDYDIIKSRIKAEVGEPKPKQRHNIKAKRYFYVQKGDRVIDIPAEQLDETLKRGFKLIKEAGK